MQNYKTPLVLLFVLGITIGYFFWNSHEKNEDNSDPVATLSEQIKEKMTPDDGLSIQDKLKLNKEELKKHNHLFVDRVQAFNPNPAVDAELIRINLEHCVSQLNTDEESVVSYKVIDNQSDSQEQYKLGLSSYCDEINDKHPEYLLTNEEDLKLLRDSLSTDTETGKILSKFYNDKNNKLNARQFSAKIQHLKNINPNLLFNLQAYFNYEIGEKLYKEISKIIKSNNNFYLYYVRKGALDLYACKAGANCGLYSNIMSDYCIFRNLCGTDYNDILENKMSEGIRLDILLVYDYLKKTWD
jgi:hypothetical protein